MGNELSATNNKLPAAKNFTSEELRWLKMTYKTLAKRSPDAFVDKETFMNFFPLPGMLGERLFAAFDTKKNGVIQYNEFLCGLSLCLHGNVDEKARFVFGMFNLNEDIGVNREELTTMIKTVVYSTSKVRDTITGSNDALEEPGKSSSDDKISRLVDSAFNKYGGSHLSFDQFREWILAHPDILNSVFKSEPLEETHLRILRNFRHSTRLSTISLCEVEKEGFVMYESKGLLKKSLQKRWAVLQGSYLYFYTNDTCEKPVKSIFMPGAFIDFYDRAVKSQPSEPNLTPIRDPKSRKFGIELYTSEYTVVMFVEQEEEAVSWLNHLRKNIDIRKIADYYTLGKEIAKGGFASVKLSTCKADGKLYATKMIDKTTLDPVEKEGMLAEIAILRLCNHPNIVKLQDIFDTPTTLYVVMELCEGDMLQILMKGRIEEKKCAEYIKQLLDGLTYLHSLGIIHRDLKASNVLFGNGEEVENGQKVVKIVDFGYSKFVRPNEGLTDPCGTMKYYAPEIVEQKEYNKPVDLWSLGILTYSLLTGDFPFSAKDDTQLLISISKGKYSKSGNAFKGLSENCQNFIGSLLQVNPKKRLTAEEALNHPWIASN
eukprot:Nk52_evm51s1737 gene=Nk52_evmTU51s1737